MTYYNPYSTSAAAAVAIRHGDLKPRSTVSSSSSSIMSEPNHLLSPSCQLPISDMEPGNSTASGPSPPVPVPVAAPAHQPAAFYPQPQLIGLPQAADGAHMHPMPPGVSVSPSVSSVVSPGGVSSPYNAQPVASPMAVASPMSGVHSPAYLGQFSLPDSASLLSPGNYNKHICAICADRASGKHYGVYSCEGCKGFFKRTVRKDLRYTCRDDRQCIIDKRQRNRCQFCRYQKCLAMGMKREAVQEERQRVKDKNENEPESSSAHSDMPVDKILEAELAVEPDNETYLDVQQDPVTNICHAADKQLFMLVEWAKRVPHFVELPLDDQVVLLKAGWNELLIAAFSYRSTAVKNGILLATGLHVHRNAASKAGVGTIFERILNELIAKMRDIKMDRTELGCLRAIVLFNPEAKGLSCRGEVEQLRDKVYASLEDYCRTQYPEETGRFAKLLLRLPALRSIGLKCLEHLFFFKLMGDTPIDTFLLEMLETQCTMN